MVQGADHTVIRENLLPDLGQQRLDTVLGLDVAALTSPLRGRQPSLVEFSLHGDGELFHGHDGIRNRVRRQEIGEGQATRRDIEGVHGGRDNPCGDTRGGITGMSHPDVCGENPVDGQQRLLDFTGLDSETPDLDLPVAAANEFVGPVRSQPHQITGAVHDRPGLTPSRSDETRRGQSGTAMVATGEPYSAHVQLPHCPGGNGPQVLVEDGGGQAVHHLTDRNRSGFGTVQAVPGDVDRRLGRAIQVEHWSSKHLSSDR